MSETTGSCLCGAVCYAVTADPVMVAICHCENCRRQSGSAFSIVGALADAAYVQTGATAVFDDMGASGQIVHRHFCGRCGSPIISLAESMPGLTMVKAGTLDDPGRWVPTMEAWCDSALGWVTPSPDRHHEARGGGA